MPYLNVGDGHQLYYQIQGDIRSATPLLFVHGGPGAGVREADKQLFAGLRRPVIYFDQRGCGRSKYTERLHANTTAQLIADIEQLRSALAIEQFILVGGSWGSTLSLLYAIDNPQRVSRLILWGIFLCREQELNWFYRQGANQLYPDEYQHFIDAIDQPDRPVAAYFRLLSTGSTRQQQAAAVSWARWEAVNSFLTPDKQKIAEFSEPAVSLPMAQLASYYFNNHGFIEEDFILRHSARLQDIAIDIVQGRYDTICPCGSAWQLAASVNQARLSITPHAAHDASEPENFKALRTILQTIEPEE
ncbi:prolyl aminopeptidase Serine peptidase. MEROPS family S33 [Arsukibacterium tuosuense]|uniref:Proline iminopeptidase n=1 Tax=Arsukibacterium tuosuense TaxID=1323745 RepID=A0A285JHM4_9GAMM|nr:prolyl aminopeptidase [Arsukibacterium tuosuense]SNY59583.1 prolyl aminopeptidase Serine peptidase. MEROPS family S33 [Arsukibacterium tuosuense]